MESSKINILIEISLKVYIRFHIDFRKAYFCNFVKLLIISIKVGCPKQIFNLPKASKLSKYVTLNKLFTLGMV